MNILIINHYAGTENKGMEYRPYYLAREWKKNNHHTTIVAGTFSHIRTINPAITGKYQYTTEGDIEYLWVKTPEYHTNGIKRFLSMLTFIFRIWIKSKSISKRRKYDTIIASSTYPLDIFPAYKIAKYCKARLVYEVHDLWPLSPMELGGYSKWHPFIMLMQYAENYAYAKADNVISILPNTLSHMVEHGLDKEKWCYIPNGIDPMQWENSEKVSEEISNNIKNIREKYANIVAYTGTFGLANALDSFLDAAKLTIDIPVAFVLFGKGPFAKHLKERAEKEEFHNVFFFDPVPKNELPHLLSLFDFLYIGLQNQPLFRFGISPNKLIDYMMSGKPVIQAINAGNNMVEEAGCGLSVEPENPAAIADAIRKLCKMTLIKQQESGQNGRQYILKNHTYQYLADNFIRAISNSKT
jgi:glycosyltransferase involved in cell wall biosynthesis